MTRTRVALTTSLILAGTLLVQGVILALYGYAFDLVAYAAAVQGLFDPRNVNPTLLLGLLASLLHYGAFGAGVYVSIRFVAPIAATDPWRRVIVRGVVATVFGAVAAVVFGAIVSLIAAVTIGAYPFGYSLDAAVDPNRIQFGIQNVIGGALTPFVAWLPTTVLAVVFLKLWLVAHPRDQELREPALRAT